MVGVVGSALIAKGWASTVARQRDEHLDRTATTRTVTISSALANYDEHGHQAGDRLLKAAAAAWEGRVRKTDLLARYGGEEFAVLLPDCALDDAMEIAERLRTAQPEGTCSIGMADWDGREDVAQLVARADRALYAAKAAGRDRCFADPAPADAAGSRVP
jgi:diguanylate cyclase (GGDEF)-like protein